MAKNDAQVQTGSDLNAKNGSKDGADGEVSTKKRPVKLFIIIAVLMILASGAGGYFIFSGSEDSDSDVVAEVIEPKAIYFALNPKFKTNYQVDGRPRLFQIGMTLVSREQDVIDALMIHGPSIKSRLVILLSGQQAENLQTPEGRELLREACLSAVQEIMNKEIGKPGIEKVLFTDFVMQWCD